MKRSSLLFALALLSVFFALPSYSQDLASTVGQPFNVFAEFSGARSGQGVGNLWGASAGAYLQGHFLGLVLRGNAEPSGGTVHIFSAVLGPRLALDLPLARIFVEAGGGMGHTGYYDSLGNFGSGWGPSWQVDAGISHGIFPRLSWRILEAGYGHIYVGPGVSPIILSTGLTLHL